MHGERDNLVKTIIPQLRKLCSERDVSLSCVDLRWGVTEAQTQGAATLLMCLRELEKCNVFIGMLGERYGWCQSQDAYKNPTQQDELLKRSLDIAAKEFPWLQEYAQKSVTEIEMQAIIQQHYQGRDKAAWFFLRDRYYVESVDESERSKFLSEGNFHKAKLDELKQTIQSSPFPCVGYNRPSHLAELVHKELEYYLNQMYPEGTELAPLQKERFRHVSFCKRLTNVYLAKEQWFLELDKFASSNTTTPLIAVGSPGIGKSALLANWAKRYRQHHPEDILIDHYIGCSPSSSDHAAMLRRIMNELQDTLGDTTSDIPTRNDTLIRIFTSWLEKTMKRNHRQRLVLVLDALDSLDDIDSALNYLWLPRQFPALVRVVISCSPGPQCDLLIKRSWPTLSMSPLSEGERISFIRQFLSQHSKRLSEKHEFKIAKSKQAGNPRYLQTLLEDISVWGEFEELDTRITKNLQARNASELYERVLDRLETDYDKENSGTVKYFMSYLWASRRGLYEVELGKLLEKKNIPNKKWSTFFLVVEDLLFSSGGIFNFSNGDIRTAVKKKYFQDSQTERSVHLELAEYFKTSTEGVSDRKVEELCWQLEKAEDWDTLRECLSHMTMFHLLYKNHKYELFRFWRNIEKKTSRECSECYTAELARGDNFPTDVIAGDLYYEVGIFLEEMGKFDASRVILDRARYFYEVSSQTQDVARVDYALARILATKAQYGEAEKLLLKALELQKREHGDNHVEVSHVLNRLASLYVETEKYSKAEKLFKQTLRIRKERLGPKNSRVGQTLKHMITLYERQRKPQEALKCGKEALKITEDSMGHENLNVAGILQRMGRLYMSLRRYREADQAFKRAFRITCDKLGDDHPYTSDIMYELACFYLVKPEELGYKVEGTFSIDAAEEWFSKALASKRKAVGNVHPDVARILNRLGAVHIERTEYAEAEKYLKEALDIRLQSLGKYHSRVAQTYKHFITLYQAQERWKSATDAGMKALAIIEKLNGDDSMQVANIVARLADISVYAGTPKAFTRNLVNRAKRIKTAHLGADHKQVEELDHILQSLTAPPPPPPPPVAYREISLEEAAPAVTEEVKKDVNRHAYLADIMNIAKKKQQKAKILRSHKPKTKKRNIKKQQGWWKQGYAYDGIVPPPPKPSALCAKSKKPRAVRSKKKKPPTKQYGGFN
mmetsp:Transcript_24246/g.26929  ORF Transcript_24246/g.26929 Transcript_24246/m.26929 type:complete len:1179 (+) Transcript_24246:885-4421(+)